MDSGEPDGWSTDEGDPLGSSRLWSHRCRWEDLAELDGHVDDGREGLVLTADWARRWTATRRYGGGEVTAAVRDLASMPTAGAEPVRGFSWHRGQRHRPGLQFLVSTGRYHGYESLQEARLLLALDFAADPTDVVSQPLRLRYSTGDGWREHTPDFLADIGSGRWLIDVRPAARVAAQDRVAFAATAEAALLHGWFYAVVTGWKPHVATTVDALSSQRRPLTDPLGMIGVLLADTATAVRPFAELAERTPVPAVARAFLLHLLWHRRVGIDLARPLSDRTLVHPAGSLPR